MPAQSVLEEIMVKTRNEAFQVILRHSSCREYFPPTSSHNLLYFVDDLASIGEI